MNQLTGPKERILETASRLFYKQGYNNTGINQILKEAKVAKASLYQHYGSKEDLAMEYLKAARKNWFEGLAQWTNTKNAPLQKVLACFDFLEYTLRNNEFRGCKFINMMSELGDTQSPLQQEILEHKIKLRTYIGDLVKKVISAETQDKSDMISDSIYLLYEGAIVESKIYKDAWPLTSAKRMVRSLLNSV